mgnify:FL=1
MDVRRSLRELPEFSKENSQDKNSSKISGRAFRGSVRCATSIPSLRSGTTNVATTIPNAEKKSRNKANYTKLNQYLNEKDFDENYALLSHYIQLQGTAEAENYKSILLQNGIDVSSLPTQKDFNKQNDIPFPCKDKTKFTFIDLFAGIGGFRLAMQDIGGKCVFSSEWDDAAKQTYFENYGEVPFGDITKPETKALIPKEFDVLCAGFPCQAFSIAGYRKGFDDVRGTLFFDVAEILEKYKPKAFFLENVKNLKTHDEGRTFAKIIDVLESRLGYKVFYKVMNPCEYANIPQNRERIFIVGFNPEKLVLPDNYEFPFPEKQKLTKTIHDVINPEIDDEKLFYKPGHIYYDRMKDVIKNPDTVYQWRRVYIRENKNNVCPTLTANMGEGGHNVPLVYTLKGIRKFTPEECLGFQGFPVNKKNPYRFPQTIAQSKKYKQAGNSVTEPLIQLVAKNVLKTVEDFSEEVK